MEIKFIKDSNTYKEGEVVELETLYANAFVAMGFAEVPTEEDKPKAKTTKTTKKTAK